LVSKFQRIPGSSFAANDSRAAQYTRSRLLVSAAFAAYLKTGG